MTQKKILCIGSVMVDMMCLVPGLPRSGEGMVVNERVVHLGGCAFNTGNIIRQLGASCYLMAPIGQGVYANFVRDELAKRGLSALDVETSLDCGLAMCLVEPDGERTMITIPGIERAFEDAWFERIDASEYDIALACGYELEGPGGDAIIRFMEENPHISFVYAPGPRVADIDETRLARIMALKPIWHLNDQELLRFTQADSLDEAGAALARECGNVIVVTMGAQGAAAFFPDGSKLQVPTDPVVPVDTIGAGDTHLGALLAGLGAGLEWEAALALANKASGAVCQVRGGTLSEEQFAQLGISLPAVL